jgi:hydrogenase maturation protease
MAKTLVLGLGNTLLGDDGVGVRMLDNLGDLGPDVEVVNGATGGLSLFETLKGFPKVVVVDAVEMGKPPGTVKRFGAGQLLSMPESRNFSLHEIGLFEVLKLGQSLNEDFGHVIIIGVQPGSLGQGEGLSRPVEENIPAVVEMVKAEVKIYDSSHA